jgi:outer membrane protein assembly factor BamB
VPVWKIDAFTGGIVWRTDYDCQTVSGVSGGVQGTLAIGKNGLSDHIFVPMARTGNASAGKLVALNKKTGDVVWNTRRLCTAEFAGRLL